MQIPNTSTFQCEFNFSDSHKGTSVNVEEHLDDVPLDDVSFPEATEKQICLQDSIVVEKTQNRKDEQGISTAHSESESTHGSVGEILIMAYECDNQKMDTAFGSNRLKPFAVSDGGSEEGISESAAAEPSLTVTPCNSIGTSKDAELSCVSIPPCATKDQESLKKQQRHLSDIANNTIAAEYFSQPTEIDDSQHGRTYENVNTSAFDTERVEVESSAGNPSENTKDISQKISHEAGLKLCFNCNHLIVIFSISFIPMWNLSQVLYSKCHSYHLPPSQVPV